MNADAEFVKLWVPDLAGVELFSARLFRHAFGKHFHDAYTIGMNESGQGCFLYGGAVHDAYPGSLHLINPGEVHTGQVASIAGWTFRNLYLSESLVRQVLTQLEWQGQAVPAFTQPVVWDPPLRLRFAQLFQALSTPTAQLAQQSLLLEALAQLFQRHAAPPQRQCAAADAPRQETKAVAQIRAYLEANYAENVSIETLSQLVELSPSYLIRSFRQQVGLPPHSYQRQWQLLQAKRSLRTRKPLSEIALAHGFYDQSHLNRSFKRAFGITPGQYQKGALNHCPEAT